MILHQDGSLISLGRSPGLAASCRQTSQLTVLHHRLADPLEQGKHPQHGPHGSTDPEKNQSIVSNSSIRNLGGALVIRSHSIFWMDPMFRVSAKGSVPTKSGLGYGSLSLNQNNCHYLEANMEIPTKTLKMAVLESWRGLVS